MWIGAFFSAAAKTNESRLSFDQKLNKAVSVALFFLHYIRPPLDLESSAVIKEICEFFEASINREGNSDEVSLELVMAYVEAKYECKKVKERRTHIFSDNVQWHAFEYSLGTRRHHPVGSEAFEKLQNRVRQRPRIR